MTPDPMKNLEEVKLPTQNSQKQVNQEKSFTDVSQQENLNQMN